MQAACGELEAAQRAWLEAAAALRVGARRAPGGALPLAVVSRRKRERGRSTAQRKHVLTCTCMRGRWLVTADGEWLNLAWPKW